MPPITSPSVRCPTAIDMANRRRSFSPFLEVHNKEEAVKVRNGISVNGLIKRLDIRRAPTDVNLVRHSSDSVTLRWAYPSEPLECGLYFIISGTVDGAPIQQVADGRSREHRFENNPALDWSLQIRAANRVGNGPQATAVRLNEGSNRGKQNSTISALSSNLYKFL